MTDAFAECAMPANEAGYANVNRPACGPLCTGVGIVTLAVQLVCALGCSPPDWIQPSIVGLIWANLFLLGIAAGNVRRGSACFACLGGCLLWISQAALRVVTHLSNNECLLLATLLCAAGWLVSHLDNLHSALRKSYSDAIQFRQWTIWDLAGLTTLAAVICFTVPRFESPTGLLIEVAGVLVGGVICSWAAYRWVFDDHWTLVKLLAVTTVGVLGWWILVRQSPAEYSGLQILAWMLTGPLAVIASQGLAVLVCLTAVRVDLTVWKPTVLPTSTALSTNTVLSINTVLPTNPGATVPELRVYRV